MTGGRALGAALLAAALWMPALAAGERCPWLNAATAGGVLGGEVQATVSDTNCEYVRTSGGQEKVLRIEVRAASAEHAQCRAGATALKAIGNEAQACTYAGKDGVLGEQVVGRVRDQAFLVRITTNDRTATAASLREKARNVAEQVAGFLF